MRIEPFRLERYFARHEFTARHLLSPSDCEALSLRELLGMASPESLALWEEMRLGYTESQGHPLLRSLVAELYESASPEEVLLSAPQEAIFLVMHALLEPRDQVIVLTPAYQSLHEVARSIGCEVTPWPLRIDGGGWHLDLDYLKRILTDRTRLLVINFPHNPTGYVPARETFDSIVEIARANRLHLLGDEIYRRLEHNPEDRLPATCDVYERGISLSGLSKCFGLPGLRMGWLAMRDASLLKNCIGIKDYTTICHSAPSEILAIIALGAREEILERSRGIVLDNLAAAAGFFARHRLFRWIAPCGGTIAFPAWDGPVPVADFCQRMLEERGILAAPGSFFDHDGSHFRVGLGRRTFPAVLEEVDQFCRDAFSVCP